MYLRIFAVVLCLSAEMVAVTLCQSTHSNETLELVFTSNETFKSDFELTNSTAFEEQKNLTLEAIKPLFSNFPLLELNDIEFRNNNTLLETRVEVVFNSSNSPNSTEAEAIIRNAATNGLLGIFASSVVVTVKSSSSPSLTTTEPWTYHVTGDHTTAAPNTSTTVDLTGTYNASTITAPPASSPNTSTADPATASNTSTADPATASNASTADPATASNASTADPATASNTYTADPATASNTSTADPATASNTSTADPATASNTSTADPAIPTTVSETAPAQNVLVLEFRSPLPFTAGLANKSSSEFKELETTTKNALEPIYEREFDNFFRLDVVGFRNGSIITETQLIFNVTVNSSVPLINNIADTLKSAIENGSLPLNISADSISVTVNTVPAAPTTIQATNTAVSPIDSSAVPATASLPTATALSTATAKPTVDRPVITTAPTTTPAPAVLVLVFSSPEPFTLALGNTSSLEFKTQSQKTKDALEPIYEREFDNFIRLDVVGFRNGSIITETQLIFNITGNSSVPLSNNVANTLKSAIVNGSVPLNISADSISVTVNTVPAAPTTIQATNTAVSPIDSSAVPATASLPTATALNTATAKPTVDRPVITTAPTTTPAPAVLVLVFSSPEPFTLALGNTSSLEFKTQSQKTKDALEPIYESEFDNFIGLDVVGFRNGSIITETQLIFDVTGNSSVPRSDNVADTLKRAIVNGSVPLNISADSISVTVLSTTAAPTTSTEAGLTATSTSPSTASDPPITATAASTAAQTTSTTASTTVTQTTTAAPNRFQLSFSSNETFIQALAINTSEEFINRKRVTKDAIQPVYSAFPSFLQFADFMFRNGSIITLLRVDFGPTGAGPAISADAVASALRVAVNNGNISGLSINFSSISVIVLATEPTASAIPPTASAIPPTIPPTASAIPPSITTASSPSVNSFFSSFGMTLLFLLLSALM